MSAGDVAELDAFADESFVPWLQSWGWFRRFIAFQTLRRLTREIQALRMGFLRFGVRFQALRFRVRLGLRALLLRG